MLLINKGINLHTKRNSSEVQKRVWLEGKRFAKYAPIGMGLKITDNDEEIVIDFVDPNSEEATRTVSKRKARGDYVPLIEINECNSELLTKMSEDEVLRIVVKENGIRIRANKNTVASRRKEREESIKYNVANNIPLDMGSIFAGGGTFDHAGHEGFELSGLSTVVRFAIDNDPDCIENLATNVHHVFDSRSVLIESDISLLNVGNGALPKLNLLKLTPPCTDASKAGKAKKGNKFETSKTAHLIYYYSQIIERTNPAYVIVENVPSFQNEVSFHLLRALLESWEYKIHLRVINSHSEGFSLETRERMFLVAESAGLDSGFDLDHACPIFERKGVLGEILDDVPLDDDCWKSKQGLIEKEKRDREAGKGFRMQIFNEESTYIGTIRAQYTKSGSSDPLIKHPEKDMFRLINKEEHCRLKSLPESFVEGWPETTAHKFLGNGLDGMTAKSITFELGRCIGLLNSREAANQQLEPQAA